jgi:hypothetical protein
MPQQTPNATKAMQSRVFQIRMSRSLPENYSFLFVSPHRLRKSLSPQSDFRMFFRHCEERSDEAIQSHFAVPWIASRSLSSGAHSRDPLARNDG